MSADPTSFPPHPLEQIPLFRRWRPSPLRNLLYTGLWNCLIGLGLTLYMIVLGGAAPSAALLGETLLTANLIGFPIHAGHAVIRRLRPADAAQRRHWPVLAGLILMMVCCVEFGILASKALLDGHSLLQPKLGSMARIVPIGIGVALAMAGVFSLVEKRLVREKLAAIQQERIAEANRLLAEARLRALQAQIEPHFLYNTLANVVSLIGSDPARARHMLERLIDFLRASLSASRADQASVGAELDLAGAYLDVLAVRLGSRLRYRIEADAACRALPLAPMLVQPLVENAVMHGIEPKVAGGEIVIRAGLAGELLRIEVSDDGAGLATGQATPRPGGGVGLANLRDRLRSLHGAAQVQLLENQHGGVTSRLLLPVTSSALPSSLPAVPSSNPSAP